MIKKLLSNWYLVIVFGFLIFAGLVFLICGEDSIIAVHDNLDLFIPQFQMMKDTGTFWAQDAYVPFLGGISRDVLPSEFSLYTILYMILPAYPAYIVGYLLKIIIALISCTLLAKDFCGEAYQKYKPLVYLTGLAYGILNLFPAFGIPFASIPLVIYLIRKIYQKPSIWWYVALFFYPILSYFSYFGLFILAYMAVAFLWLWIRDKKFPLRILIAIVVLSAGCILFEYRLFGTMLFSEEETIRSTIVAGSMSAGEIMKTISDVFFRGMFHAESVHTYLVLPVCVVYFFFLNISYIRNKNVKGIFHDVYNLLMLILVFNSVIYGIYYWEGFRNLVETICPPLTGWQFNRTVFFSPFVWYAAFFLVLVRLYDAGKGKKMRLFANALAVAAILLIVFTGSRYNDLYHTCYNELYQVVKGKPTDQLSYKEFYAEELFEQAKEDLEYCGQWSAAYGFYPAVLEYNGISTVDGYLGFYSQYYKDEFRKVIAPALERVEATRQYYDEWGARAYLYSGTDLSIVSPSRNVQITDQDIYIDLDAFKSLGGRYIFSSIELTNAKETGLVLAGTYTHEDSPYTLYVYQTASRYKTKEHTDLSFEEMKPLIYDAEEIRSQIDLLKELAEQAKESGIAQEPEKVLETYQALVKQLTIISTCNSIADIVCYQDVTVDVSWEKKEEILADLVEIWDDASVAIREICDSPYKETMETVMHPKLVESYIEYEEQTDREKEITIEENSLTQEYNQAAAEDYTVEYKGQEWNLERFYQEGDQLEREEYIELYQAINKERNSVLGEIFLELVVLRDEEAKIKGYDNYAEYAYEELYIRDYTLEEMEELLKEIKKKIVPIFNKVTQTMLEKDYYTCYMTDPEVSAQQILELVYPYMNEIDPELAEGMEYMLTHNLYDMDASPVKGNVGFTTDLFYYNTAFIFDSPLENFRDYSTAVHEFGHYNWSHRSTENVLTQQNNIDLCEIHSQGLEALYYDYFTQELGEEVSFVQIYELLDAIVSAALVSEFEIEVYRNPDMTLEDMNKLYLNLSEKYGSYYADEITELYTWMEISHIFESPCYYVSYMTSAFSSLDLLSMAQENRHEAVETYMELTTLPSNMPYCSAVEWVGLRDIFEKGVPKKIAQETADILLDE
ncbi:MAG: DUF6044 family protein [Bacillota bacterium]|nr:DUF6044 family protein [Bacillota bacterium]